MSGERKMKIFDIQKQTDFINIPGGSFSYSNEHGKFWINLNARDVEFNYEIPKSLFDELVKFNLLPNEYSDDYDEPDRKSVV